jgi:hypothetical protein
MDPSIIQDFGLAAAVIAALFFLINKFLEDMQRIRVEHAEERKIWLESQERRDMELQGALHELSAAIQAQNSRVRRFEEDNK